MVAVLEARWVQAAAHEALRAARKAGLLAEAARGGAVRVAKAARQAMVKRAAVERVVEAWGGAGLMVRQVAPVAAKAYLMEYEAAPQAEVELEAAAAAVAGGVLAAAALEEEVKAAVESGVEMGEAARVG